MRCEHTLPICEGGGAHEVVNKRRNGLSGRAQRQRAPGLQELAAATPWRLLGTGHGEAIIAEWARGVILNGNVAVDLLQSNAGNRS